MPTAILHVKEYPTRYAAFANPNTWVFLDIDWSSVNYQKKPTFEDMLRCRESPTDVRWSEMAVYDCPATKTHAVVGRFPHRNGEYYADVSRDGRGRVIPAPTFLDALREAQDFVG